MPRLTAVRQEAIDLIEQQDRLGRVTLDPAINHRKWAA